MARLGLSFATVALCLIQTWALPYLEEYVDWNLNTKEGETDPTQYWGEWENHEFHPSPDNWRFPFYTLFLDRFVNGDPTNDNINGTLFEVDITSNQLRYGGDIQGLIDTLDYIQGMGIKVGQHNGGAHALAHWLTLHLGPVHRRQPLHELALGFRRLLSHRPDAAGLALRQHHDMAQRHHRDPQSWHVRYAVIFA